MLAFPDQKCRGATPPSAIRHAPMAVAVICMRKWWDVGGARRAAAATPDTARLRLEVIAKIHSGMARSRSDTDGSEKTKNLMNI